MLRFDAMAVSSLALAGLAGCDPTIQEQTAPPASLACEVVVDEIVASVAPFGASLAVGPDGSVFVAWTDEGLRVARRVASATWEDADDGVRGLPGSVVLTGGGRAGPALHLLADALYTGETSRVVRYGGAGWETLFEAESDQVLNQNSRPIAIAADGAVHFTMSRGDFAQGSALTVDLYRSGTSPDPVHVTAIDGRDPSLAVDDAGTVHVLYAKDGEDRRLLHGSPFGAEAVYPERSGWPQIAVSGDSIGAYTRDEEDRAIVVVRSASSWVPYVVGEPATRTCPAFGSFDTDHEDETCDFLLHTVRGGALLGGPRLALVAAETHEEGVVRWNCPNTFDAPCDWKREAGFVDTTRLVIGLATSSGVSVAALPITLPEGLDYAWSVTGDQDGDGVVHLLITQSSGGAGDGDLRYVRLACE
jgi:hypothetical protein